MTLSDVSQDPRAVHLTGAELAGRTFLLGNGGAFQLALPAALGSSPAVAHPHKWFGASSYSRKYLEGQLVRAVAGREHLLSRSNQTRLSVGLADARREYEVEGLPCRETYFVPDGLKGFACRLEGDMGFILEPELDMRNPFALSHTVEGYEVEPIADGVVISRALPATAYDDRTESLMAVAGSAEREILYAAILVLGSGARVELASPSRRCRRKLFRKDQQRHRFLAYSASEGDHAPLWDESSSRVYVPVRFCLDGPGVLIYGFGESREEALAGARSLREHLASHQALKAARAARRLERARLETGSETVDLAHAHVLTRLMDALVARQVKPADTAIESPVTTILAGNQYFQDSWKRDENIALGALLALGFYDLARDVINGTWQLQDPATGRLPQRIRVGETPAYHSSDGTLWALLRLHQYRGYTGDETLLAEKLPMVECFFERSLDRTVEGMLPSGRTAASDYLWETWMDTPHTPRDGFPIEIQMLWIACLQRYRPLLRQRNPRLEARMEAAERAAWDSLERFQVDGMPVDGLDEELVARDLITPNPYFSFGLGLDLGQDREHRMRHVGRKQLAGRQGILTLAPQDWGRVFAPEFLADRRNVRGRSMRSVGKYNYHRGVEWNWLAQFFVRAELKYAEPGLAFRRYLQGQVAAALQRGGIGGIAELFDLSGVRGPEFQAWSMAGFLEALHAFAGVEIDVPAGRLAIAPQLPDSWPRLSVRKWYGEVPFDLSYSAQGAERRLSVSFPEGPPQIELDVTISLPRGRAVESVDLRLDGVWHVPPHRIEPVPGSPKRRVRLTIPAVASLELRMVTRRTSLRTVRTPA